MDLLLRHGEQDAGQQLHQLGQDDAPATTGSWRRSSNPPCTSSAPSRGKDEYTLEEKNGKQTPKKIGMGYKQRDNTEYEYTITFNIDQATHVASAMKDNTHLFENRYGRPDGA